MTKLKRTKEFSKMKKKPHKSKQALTAYNLFYSDERKKLDDSLLIQQMSHKKIGRLIGERWRALDVATRSFYELAALERERCHKETLSKQNGQDKKVSSSTLGSNNYFGITNRKLDHTCNVHNTKSEISPELMMNLNFPFTGTNCNSMYYIESDDSRRIRAVEDFSSQERIFRSIEKSSASLDDDFVDFVLSLDFA